MGRQVLCVRELIKGRLDSLGVVGRKERSNEFWCVNYTSDVELQSPDGFSCCDAEQEREGECGESSAFRILKD